MNYIMANIFLGCFLFGFVLTASSFLFGFDAHHGGGHAGGHGAGGDAGAGHAGHAGSHGNHSVDHDSGNIPFLNYNTIVMFITWFGAAGYVLNREATVGPVIALFGAVFAGFVGALLVFYFLRNILIRAETPMNPADYYLPGTMAKVTSGIRAGGTGEIVYVQGGTRKTAGARSDEGLAHPFGEEVVIIRYEKGLAYVRSVESLERSEVTRSPEEV